MLFELYQWMLSWSESPYAAAALFVLAFAESSFFPIPPDVLLMSLVLGKPEHGLYFAGITTAGSVLGGAFGYGLGWVGGRPLLVRWIGEQRVRRVHDVFQRYEAWAILAAGFTPIPYKVFTIGAGAFYVDFRTFMAASCLARGARFLLVAGALQVFGPAMKRLIEQYFDIFAVLFFILLIGGFFLVRHYAERSSRSQTDPPTVQ